MQGMGWLCLEELIWGDKQHSWVRPGTLLTRGPGTYKIPSATDIPIDFRSAAAFLLFVSAWCRLARSTLYEY